MSGDSSGLSDSGFTPARQTDIINDLNASFTDAFGADANLSSTSLFGNLIAIFSAPLASVWELMEGVWNSQFTAGAEGVAVDNVLELDGMARLPATYTITGPDGVASEDGVINGFVVYGNGGTVVTAGSICQTTATPPLSFTVDEDITISDPLPQFQSLNFSGNPGAGSCVVTVTTMTGERLTTSAISGASFASSMESAINALVNSALILPFTDVECRFDTGTSTMEVQFGGDKSPLSGDPTSEGFNFPLIEVDTTLLTESDATTPVVLESASITSVGVPGYGVGSATCTTTGPNVVLANTLTVISTPISGWTSVNNDIDCIPGTNTETDVAALARRRLSLGGGGGGKLSSIKTAVAAVPGVVSVQAFENLSSCALQNITIPYPTPTTGNYQIVLGGGVTGDLAPGASSRDLQAAINALDGYNVIVSGSPAYGFQVDFNGSFGGASQPLILTRDGSAGAMPESPIVTYGRPPNSFEIVVLGGDDDAILQAILNSQPTGIGSYASPVLVATGNISDATTLNINANRDALETGMLVTGPGIFTGTTATGFGGLIGLPDTDVTLSQNATSGSGTYVFSRAAAIIDEDNVTHFVGFTRAQDALQYIAITLLTDYYNVPGDSSSGINTNATFVPSSTDTIVSEIVAIGKSVQPGGLIVIKGFSGLVGAFNNVPGIIDYALAISSGSAPDDPVIGDPMPPNVQLLPAQVGDFEAGNVSITWS
jgi:hypothetical protein